MERVWYESTPAIKDPVISDEDVRYLAERAAVAGLPLTETWRDVRSLQGEAPKPPENEAGDIHTAEQLPDPARPQPGKGGRKPGSGAIDDEAAIRRMLKILAQDEGPLVFAAARVVAERDGVEGLSFESTRRRLSLEFARRYGTQPPSGKSWSDIVDFIARQSYSLAIQFK